jgi:hypothetical protein
MHTYCITLFVEQTKDDDGDLEFVEFVQSNDRRNAIEQAKCLVGAKNPGVNLAKATAWSVGLFRSLEAAGINRSEAAP